MNAQQKPPKKYRKATYQDVIDAPPNKVAELIDGTLYVQSRPAMPFALAKSALSAMLVTRFGKNYGSPGGWRIIYEPELHFGEDVLVPDITGWRRERMPEIPDVVGVTLPPDWVCEVLSSSTHKLDLGSKRDIYAREGVPWLWLTDLKARTLEALELRDGEWVSLATLTDNATVSLPPFEAIKFSLGDLWSDLKA
ncbi:MAG: Uma2 family endonuclease [Pseudohongiellaceae bacterium]